MHNGYYQELDAIRQEYPDADWGFMENECTEISSLSAYDFLHGHCNVFAELLAERYGYRLESIFNGSALVHSYCVDESGMLFVDIRGKTDNWDEFINDFLDEIELPDIRYIPYPVPGTVPGCPKAEDGDVILVAQEFIRENISVYN